MVVRQCLAATSSVGTLGARGRIGRAPHRLRRFSLGSLTNLYGFVRKPPPPAATECRPEHLDTFSRQVGLSPSLSGQFKSRPRRGDSRRDGWLAPHRTDDDPMAKVQAEVRGYDPDRMVWTTVLTTNGEPKPQESFKSAALASAVARRAKAGHVIIASPTDAASPAAAAIDTPQKYQLPPAPRSAGAQGKKKRVWKPLPLPKPAPTDFVVIIKSEARLALTTVFPENNMCRAILTHRGFAAGRSVTIAPVSEQDLILVYTTFRRIAEKIIGEFAVTAPARLGTYNKVRLTFSGKVKPRYVLYDALLIPVQQYKTVPACGLCGSIGHRPHACSGPKPDICGLCCSIAALVDACTHLTSVRHDALFVQNHTSPCGSAHQGSYVQSAIPCALTFAQSSTTRAQA
ncbi:hypothetical protein HPB49_005041 [Dermacentor silvarum]|uniref:Uncharacterized protein n=1 Tax=Dermacentor silvarum TaxID=543639 RepID=A0ACB8CV52_DERSI|nr:hypothetical protein HPB49_005041 [Dermacentor silvarum]